MECLSVIALERGMSRDEAVRHLLLEHVEQQAKAIEEERLTHISTVLRYPPPRPGRGSDGRLRLAPRLDPGLAARAGSMSLRLPGQAKRRGFRDYGARPLTDAVVTAIARVRPFVDEGLEGLPPLLRQREAVGLWRLTVAATLTRAEQRALLASETDPTAEVLREEDVAWHAPWRFEVAGHLARRLLTGPHATPGRRMLWDQTEEFNCLRFDLERSDELDHPLLEGLSWPAQNLQGRGGAAVWRAQRTLTLEGLAQWLTSGRSPAALADPPGWTLREPEAWHGYRFGHGHTLPAQQRSDLNSGRVVRVDYRSRSVLWPYDDDGAPVLNFAAVIARADGIAPVELAELVLVTSGDIGTYPYVPAQVACELGFISTVERDRLVVVAAARTQAEIAGVLSRAQRLTPIHRAELEAVADDPERFTGMARRSYFRCYVYRPTWCWEVSSIAVAIAGGATAAQLRWLVGATRDIRRRALEESMREAANRAFWLGGTVVGSEV